MNRAEAAVLARAALAAKQPKLEDRFWSKVKKGKPLECWPWIAAFRNNRVSLKYGAFWLNGRHQPASRVALILSGVDVPEGMDVCHRCDNPPCCNPAHLFVGTAQDNMDDKTSKSRQVMGCRVHTAKLTAEDVLAIRALKPEQPGQRGLAKALAEKYGVRQTHINDIWARRTWRQI
jgi:hypothetical protein